VSSPSPAIAAAHEALVAARKREAEERTAFAQDTSDERLRLLIEAVNARNLAEVELERLTGRAP